MSKVLTGMTHAIVRTNTKADAELTKIYAYVDLCFGPGDENALCNIAYKQNGAGHPEFTPPVTAVVKDGKKVIVPLVTGQVATKILLAATAALDRVKAAKGLKYGKSFKVFANGVEEIPQQLNIPLEAASK